MWGVERRVRSAEPPVSASSIWLNECAVFHKNRSCQEEERESVFHDIIRACVVAFFSLCLSCLMARLLFGPVWFSPPLV